ncbi:MAG: acyltransferase [Chitinophagaceae bacterium]|nr:acyltransferase [Chitinophagaceae bacterium]
MKHNKRLLELDALRGIAALFVVFFHFTIFRPEAALGFNLGVTGVDLFFIISGFVIFLTLEKVNTLNDFLVSRVSRLYPAYWICVTITFLLIIIASGFPAFNPNLESLKPPGAWEYFANLTMFQYYVNVQNIDGPYWSLIIELLFYIFMIFIFIIRKLNRIESIGAGILGFIALYSFFLRDIFPFAHKLFSLGIPLINYFPLFFSGIIIYKIRFYEANIKRYLLLAACFLVQVSLFDDGVRSHGYVSHSQYLMMLVLYFSLFILYVNNFLGFIVNKVTLFLGQISYPLYLIHQFISVDIIIPLLTNYFGVNFWVAAFIISLGIVILIATLVNTFIEIPAMKFIRKDYENRKISKTVNKPSISI